MKIILYTTSCPKCLILKKKLDDKNIKYETEVNIDIIKEKGFFSMPILEVDGEALSFEEAVNYINNL